MKFYAAVIYQSGIKHLLVMVDARTISEARSASPPFNFKHEDDIPICLYNLSTNSYYDVEDVNINKGYTSHLNWIIVELISTSTA